MPDNKSDKSSYRARRFPFTFKEEKWSDDAPKEKVKIGDKKSVSFEDDFNVLSGHETGEQFLIWWIDYETKILKNDKLGWKERKEVLLRLVKDDALIIVQKAYRETMSTNPADYPKMK